MITLKIDFNKIDQIKLFPGKQGLYLDLVLFETPNSQYADYIVKQSLSKEERDAGVEAVVLGDGKNWTRNHNEIPE